MEMGELNHDRVLLFNTDVSEEHEAVQHGYVG